ncbi:MAG: DUF86 domain-containing protein [Deltaproteobacteria bacterium]|jgi:uncharacterized protein YutE (UPF0331/DUF86 family)|nr:DUF86 domain-containing protein [Deltaproteobacteria bacterium]
MVDETLILRKLSELEEYASQIEGFRAIAIKEYRKDWKSQRIIERTLQMMIETCVDIAGHIISDQKFRIPNSYADTFRVLNENGIMAEDLCKTMEKISKFRNVIVHHYDRVDAEIVIDILRNRINDFSRYRDVIVSWLKEQ